MIRTYSLAADGGRQLSEHFTVREFACRDGSDAVRIDSALVELLERIRAHFGGPVTVNSGYRTEAYNRKVGGAARSQHVQGTAADIVVKGASPLEVAQYAEYLQPSAGGIGVYPSFTHVDTRGNRSRWDSRSGREVVVSGWPGYQADPAGNTPSPAHREGVAWAVENGILQGTAAGDLMLSQPVTREQACTLLMRLSRLLER